MTQCPFVIGTNATDGYPLLACDLAEGHEEKHKPHDKYRETVTYGEWFVPESSA